MNRALDAAKTAGACAVEVRPDGAIRFILSGPGLDIPNPPVKSALDKLLESVGANNGARRENL
jgi:hypothetical protein